eukprot:TRINITY_DN23311_c0_g1_i1.p1 TRINITY_DN23311_c0_g1~~TRINITY_DN23311_c0_g1_i1.p1  ORF type:complete len:222 (-),score=65.53 TRINITY_DN23311_c0_g1_i1:237-902(-)
MPKKFAGENSKAVAAKERKAEKANAEKAAKKKAEDDAYWADDNKALAKKQARKDDAEKKRQEALAKKKERDELAKLEEKETMAKLTKANPVKVSQAKIREETEKRAKIAQKAVVKATEDTHLSKPLEENVNRIAVEGEEARTVEDAISILSLSGSAGATPVDKHPEKRMKAAYEEFEKLRMPQIKQENPNMRLSQLRQMLWKEWQKSPQNPLNMQLAAMSR